MKSKNFKMYCALAIIVTAQITVHLVNELKSPLGFQIDTGFVLSVILLGLAIRGLFLNNEQ